MSSPLIETFLFDDENEEEFSNHGLSTNNVLQILDNFYVILPNRKHRTGKYLIIGRDNGGNYISTPIEPTNINGIWRPITAWKSKKGEETILRKCER
jgi:uncharacterized DUF497 family protein